MGMELRTAPSRFLINDAVGAQDPDDGAGIAYGRIVEITYAGYMVRSSGERTGPWAYEHLFHDVTAHADYPHYPGTLYDCPGCEAIMPESDSEPLGIVPSETGQRDAKTP